MMARRPIGKKPARSIVALGPAAVVATLDHISKDPGGGERYLFVTAAVQALASVGEVAAPGLSEGLWSREAKIRSAAASIVQVMGPAGRAACAGLVAAMDDENRWVRYDAIDALGSLGKYAAPASKRLGELAISPDSVARRHAIEALGHIGPEARDALPILEKIASDDADSIARGWASRAAMQIDIQRLAHEGSAMPAGR